MSINRFNLFETELNNALSEEEQKEYLKLSSMGNKHAKDVLFEHNLRLVPYAIKKYLNDLNIDKDELLQVGSIGLLKAIEMFDISYNYEFSTYAIPKIIGEIKNYIKYNDVLHIPKSLKNTLFQIMKIENNYKGDLNVLNSKKLSEILNVPESEIILALKSKQDLSSLSTPMYVSYKNGDDASLDSVINNVYVQQAIDMLDEREQIVIKSLNGINTKIKTQMEIAKILNISQARVSKINMVAMKKLRNILTKWEPSLNLIKSNNIK